MALVHEVPLATVNQEATGTGETTVERSVHLQKPPSEETPSVHTVWLHFRASHWEFGAVTLGGGSRRGPALPLCEAGQSSWCPGSGPFSPLGTVCVLLLGREESVRSGRSD